jgi:formylglycine-generating enzyme required for sulfatase activity
MTRDYLAFRFSETASDGSIRSCSLGDFDEDRTASVYGELDQLGHDIRPPQSTRCSERWSSTKLGLHLGEVRALDLFDFDLEIGEPASGTYPVAVVRSPVGEARAEMRFPYDTLALEGRLKDLQIALLSGSARRRRALSDEEATVQDFGQTLFEALFTGSLRSVFERSRDHAIEQGRGLRVRLRFRSPDLAGLPWEFMYDPSICEYLCLSTDTPVVRYLELPQPTPPLLITPPLRVLAMAASPSDLPELDLERERQRLEEATLALQSDGQLELRWLDGQTWRHLQRALRPGAGPWHVFHFVGHGGFDEVVGEGLVALSDENGRTYRLSATDLGRLLGDHHPMRLAVLNSCEGARANALDTFSSTAATLVRRGTPAVLAMQYEITDQAAIELSRAFYESIVDGLAVDVALTEARKSVRLSLHGTLEWGTPVLFMRTSDGVLFTIDSTTPTSNRPSGTADSDARLSTTHVFDEPPVTVAPVEGKKLDSSPNTSRQPKVKQRGRPRPDRRPHKREPAEAGTVGGEQPGPGGPARDTEVAAVPGGQFAFGFAPNWGQLRPSPWHSPIELRQVDVPEFQIGRFPVTNHQFSEYVSATGTGRPKHWGVNGPAPEILAHPVVWVTWRTALAYCEWLAEMTGLPYGLPTEEQWEKAARSVDARTYPWGNDWDTTRCHVGTATTTRVDAHTPRGDSPYGVADTVGNAREWTATTRKDTYAIVRGGGFRGDSPAEYRLTCMYREELTYGPKASIGFRVALNA